MPPRQTVDDQLVELESLVAGAEPAVLPAVLERALASRSFRIAALAARHAGERLVYECVPHLVAAYARFLDNPVRRDPNCIAKKAIMRALCELDCNDADFYRAGIDYRQPEPVWGGTVDTAAEVRCSAAMGLVASGDPRALIDIATLLLDSEPPVRAGAARAIACGNPKEAEMLLRFKVLAGDEEAEVIGECFASLLTVEPDEAIGFVGAFLEHEDDALRETAALALGESRHPAALDCLRQAWEGVFVPDWFRRALVRAAGLHRSDEAFSWLTELVAESNARIATEIVDVLSIYRHNEKLTRQLGDALSRRSDQEPGTRFAEVWV